ncbi:SRPBCC domain-containing protein [Brachybacterium sp. GCM10030267]|uniref:SRPBCC family protein n=1 Tax=unclassified Brachybacterium TaxID=2623841 RepID=UPI00361DC9EA
MQTEITPPPTGLTRDAGWELGVRRTLSAPLEDVWRRLLAEWLPQWLGVENVPQMVGAPMRHDGQTRGRVVGCHVGRRVRVRWTPPTLDHETVFQVTLLEASGGTTVAIHQERLLGAAERQGLLEHWTTILDELVAAIDRETAVNHDLPN